MSASTHITELATEVADAVRDARELFEELDESKARGGSGTSRDPTNIERELRDAVDDAFAASRELAAAVERGVSR
jgi:hypothetical protein